MKILYKKPGEAPEIRDVANDLNLLVDGLKRAIVIGGLKYEDTFKYVSMVEELISIRDGEIIDEI